MSADWIANDCEQQLVGAQKMVTCAEQKFGVGSPEAKEARDNLDRLVCDVLGISREEFDRLMAS